MAAAICVLFSGCVPAFAQDKELLLRAEKGDATAQNNLGIDYKWGEEGAPKDPHKAAFWFRRAARQNDKVAQDEAKQALAELHNAGQISAEEADWTRTESGETVKTSSQKAKSNFSGQISPRPLSPGEVEKGLLGGISSRRMASLVEKFGVSFALNAGEKLRLMADGADDTLLAAIAHSKRP